MAATVRENKALIMVGFKHGKKLLLRFTYILGLTDWYEGNSKMKFFFFISDSNSSVAKMSEEKTIE